MNNARWTLTEGTIHRIQYHIVWCPQYRRPVLVQDVGSRLIDLLLERSKEIDISIDSISVNPDHVRLLISCSPTVSPHWAIQDLKSYTARILRNEFPSLVSRLPSMWTRKYYIDTIGRVSEIKIDEFIKEQRRK